MRHRTPALMTALAATLVGALLAPVSASAVPSCGNGVEVRVLSDGHGILESVAINRHGDLFFTDSTNGLLLRLRKRDRTPRVILGGIDGPGGIVFKRKRRNLLVGYGATVAQAVDGTENPEAGLLQVDARERSGRTHTDGLQMANGVARGRGRAIYASNDIGTGGIDRIRKRTPRLNWANVVSANGLVADRARESLFANQTFTSAAIARVPFDDPDAIETWYAAPPADAAAGFDGLARGRHDHLYVAANGIGQIWRVKGPGDACVLAERNPFPSGPSDLAFGRKTGSFPSQNLYVTTFGGELLELVGARR